MKLPVATTPNPRSLHRHPVLSAVAICLCHLAAIAQAQPKVENEIARLKKQLVEARHEAQTQRRLADTRLHALQIGRARQFWDNGQTLAAANLLDGTNPEQRGFEYGYLRALFSENQEVLQTGAAVNMVGGEAITYSPDGKLIVAGGSDRTVRVWVG